MHSSWPSQQSVNECDEVISCKSAVSGAETAQREKAQAREKALEEKAQVERLDFSERARWMAGSGVEKTWVNWFLQRSLLSMGLEICSEFWVKTPLQSLYPPPHRSCLES